MAKIIKGHGLRGESLKDLQNLQSNEAQEKNKTGNGDSSYSFPESESHLVHASLEIERWERGNKTSKPRIQTYDPRVFAIQEANGGFEGYTVKILHNPGKAVKVEEIERIYVPKGKEEGGPNADEVGGVSGDSSAALTSMSKTQLKKKYKEVFGKDASEDLLKNDQSLIDEIDAKIKFDQEENK